MGGSLSTSSAPHDVLGLSARRAQVSRSRRPGTRRVSRIRPSVQRRHPNVPSCCRDRPELVRPRSRLRLRVRPNALAFDPDSTGCELFGTDIDEEAIAWCRASLSRRPSRSTARTRRSIFPTGFRPRVCRLRLHPPAEPLQLEWLRAPARDRARRSGSPRPCEGLPTLTPFRPRRGKSSRPAGFAFSPMPAHLQHLFPASLPASHDERGLHSAHLVHISFRLRAPDSARQRRRPASDRPPKALVLSASPPIFPSIMSSTERQASHRTSWRRDPASCMRFPKLSRPRTGRASRYLMSRHST